MTTQIYRIFQWKRMLPDLSRGGLQRTANLQDRMLTWIASGLLLLVSSACWATGAYSPYLSIPVSAPGDPPLIYLSTLTQGTDGSFYAVSPNGDGVVVSISPAGTFTVLHAFNGNDGMNPNGPLVFGSDGELYGTTATGGSGSDDGGVVYKVSTAGIFTQLHALDPIAEASGLQSGLVLASDGNFYGIAAGGGSAGLGALYRVSPSGVFAIVHSFTAAEGSEFQSPPILGPDGNLWSTSGGGPGQCGPSGNQCGFVYKITLAGVLTNVYQFTGGADGGYGGVNGGNYLGGLALGTDGNFYGLTYNGDGPAPKGTIFKVTPAGALTTLHTFTGVDGDQPRAALIQGPDGNFYGTTFTGGAGGANHGVVFSISPSGSFTVLHSFTGTDGENPDSTLILAQDGSLYGTTSGGGANNLGILYKVVFNSTLAAPTNVTAQAGNSEVVLGWAPVSGAAGYDIFQGTTAGGESSTPVATGVADTSFTATGLSNGVAYFFTVKAVNGGTSSAPSAEATATPLAAPTVTLAVAPTSVTAGSGATLTWSSSNTATCTASGTTVSDQWSGAQPGSGSQPVTTSAAGSLAFTLTCSGAGGSGSATANLTVTAPPQTATPTVSPPAGTFENAQTVTVADTTAGALIYYTTDGSPPTTSSARYSAPIAVLATTTLRVLAIATGATPSEVLSAIYTITPPPPSVLSGHSGGGAMGIEVLGLLLLAIVRVWRTRPARAFMPLMVVALGVFVADQSAHAQEFQLDFSRFTIGVRAGSSDYRTTAGDLNAAYASAGLTQTSASLERHRFVGDIYVGVPFYSPLSLQLGYVNLGEYHVSVQTPSLQAQLAAQTTVATLRPAGQGATLQLAAPIDLSRWIAIEPRAGLVVLQSKQEIATPAGTVSDNRHDAGLAGGLALLIRPTRSLYIGGGVDYFATGSKRDVLMYTGEIEFHFGSHGH
jgi:uncharacterized repeat protein (TIGR03803 family)